MIDTVRYVNVYQTPDGEIWYGHPWTRRAHARKFAVDLVSKRIALIVVRMKGE